MTKKKKPKRKVKQEKPPEPAGIPFDLLEER